MFSFSSEIFEKKKMRKSGRSEFSDRKFHEFL